MKHYISASMVLAYTLLTQHASAATLTVTTAGDGNPNGGGTSGDLRYTILQADASGTTNEIVFALANPVIQLGGILPILGSNSSESLTINGSNGGNPITIDGMSTYPGFFAYGGNVNVYHMTIQNTVSQGGNGGSYDDGGNANFGGGGGGLGAGGGLFIDQAKVTIGNVNFVNNAAVGGNGSFDNINSGGGGGGMFGGNGGAPNEYCGGGGGGLGGSGGTGGVAGTFAGQGGGGGGGIAPGGMGGNGYDSDSPTVGQNGQDGGALFFPFLAGSGAFADSGNGGNYSGGGGGGGYTGSSGGGGGGGGVFAYSATVIYGGDAGYGGGGGGGGSGSDPYDTGWGGYGGFSGGGGGNASEGYGYGGDGGFGGGGGGGGNGGGYGGFGGGGGYSDDNDGGGYIGYGGIGGGDGDLDQGSGEGSGGGGAGLGGAIFVNCSTYFDSGGGQLIIAGPVTISGSSVTAGTGANDGAAAADNIFFTSFFSSNALTFDLPSGDTVTINGVIGDDSDITLPSGHSYEPGTPATLFRSGLDKKGLGTLILNGINTYAGITTVYQGELQLNGQIAGNGLVKSGGLISGIGRVGGNLHIQSGGTIKPGNSIGTLSVTGNYTHDAGAIYIVQFNGIGQSSLIDIDGTAILNGGDVLAEPLSLPPSSQPYLILHADGGVTGEFDDVALIHPSIILEPYLTYDPNNVYLNFNTNYYASTCNQKGVVSAFSTSNSTNDNPYLLTVLGELFSLTTVADVQNALNQMSGEQYTLLLTKAELNGQQFIRRLYDPLRPIVTTSPCCNICCSPTFDVWLEASGGQTFLEGNVNCKGAKVDSYEFTGGAQTTCNCDLTVGIAGSYVHDHTDYKRSGSGNTNTGFAAIYGLYRPQTFYFLGDIAFGYSREHVKRPIHIGEITHHTASHPKIYQGFAYGEAGIDLFLCGPCPLLIQPFGGLEVSTFRRCHINEHGNDAFNLSVRTRSRTNCFTRLGIHLTTIQDPCFNISLDLAWQHRLSTTKNSMQERFQNFGNSFTVYGNTPGRDSFDGAITATTSLSDSWTLYAEATGQVWSHASSYNILAGILYRW